MQIVNAKITSVQIGFEDHGILTCWLNLDYGNGGCQGFGGYGFSHKPNDKHIGADDFADYILGILTTLKVSAWEKLPGTSVRVEKENYAGPVKRIGHYLDDRWFDPLDAIGGRHA